MNANTKLRLVARIDARQRILGSTRAHEIVPYMKLGHASDLADIALGLYEENGAGHNVDCLRRRAEHPLLCTCHTTAVEYLTVMRDQAIVDRKLVGRCTGRNPRHA